LKPNEATFTSDGCTGFPEVWRSLDLSACCTAHDLAWYNHPGDWLAFLSSNLDLAVCFGRAGAYELVIPAFLAVTTIGAFLFARKRRKKQTP
jgi:hypothetical protein